MSESILITTTVSLDCDVEQPMKHIHLVRGDSGIRRLRLVPVLNGKLIDMEAAGITFAYVRLNGVSNGSIRGCTLGDHYADFVPAGIMTETPGMWTAELVLKDGNGGQVTTCTFMIVVHEGVYSEDLVEHTDNRVVAAMYSEAEEKLGELIILMRDGEKITVTGTEHLVSMIGTALNERLLADGDRENIETVLSEMSSYVKTNTSPTLTGLTIGGLRILSDGTLEGAKFT